MNSNTTSDSNAFVDYGSRTRTRWLALFLLTSLNVLNYIDRNIYAALVPAIQRDLGFTDTQMGLLGSAFIFAYTLISPIFGYIGDRGARSGVMASGVVVWSIATAYSGMTFSYFGQLFTRITVGLGEAAYSVIAPSVIADHFPKHARGRIFALYSCAIPVGSALGYVIGGLLEPRIGWQKAFFVVGVPGILIAGMLAFMKDPPRGQQEHADANPWPHEPAVQRTEAPQTLKQTYATLFSNGGFLFTVLGYAAYTFVVGGLAFWMPTYIVRYFEGVTVERANVVFGGITVVGGFLGTILGGWWADHIERHTGNGYLKVSIYSMLLTVPLFFVTLAMRDFTSFSMALFFMDIVLFLCISPLDAAVINYVRPQLRATAMALNIFLIHALGDGISRVLMGAVSDASDLRTAVAYLPWMLLLAAALWTVVIVFFWHPMAWPRRALRVPAYQAHRGFRPQANVRENTLEAFRLAREAGAEMTECDVHLTRDQQAIVFHDFDLSRLGGTAERTADLTADEIKARTGAPRLKELLLDEASPRYLNIELKTAHIFGSGQLEREVIRAVKEAKAEERVLFSSFNPFSLRRLSRLAPDIPRALLVTSEKHPKNRIWFRKMWLAYWARPHLVHLDQNMINAKILEGFRERGITVVAWTVNDPARARELLAMGVRGVISDVLFR